MTRSKGGFSWSRLGPTVPEAFAAFNVWQPPQPALAKTPLPAAGSPFPPADAGAAAVVVGAVAVVAGDSERGSAFSRPNTSTAESIASRKRMLIATYHPTWRPGKFG